MSASRAVTPSLKTYANVNFEPDSYAQDLTTDPLMFKDQKIQVGVTGLDDKPHCFPDPARDHLL